MGLDLFKRHMSKLSGCFAVLLLTFCESCGGGSPSSSAPHPPMSVTVSPSTAAVLTSGTLQFASNVAVAWSVNGIAGGSSATGTISSGGLYTAPICTPIPSSVTVTATSQTDSSKMAAATVSLSAPPSQSPPEFLYAIDIPDLQINVLQSTAETGCLLKLAPPQTFQLDSAYRSLSTISAAFSEEGSFFLYCLECYNKTA